MSADPSCIDPLNQARPALDPKHRSERTSLRSDLLCVSGLCSLLLLQWQVLTTLSLPRLDPPFDGPANGAAAADGLGVPVCLWNLAHVPFYAFVARRLRRLLRRGPDGAPLRIGPVPLHQVRILTCLRLFS